MYLVVEKTLKRAVGRQLVWLFFLLVFGLGLQLEGDLRAAGKGVPIVFVTAYEDEQSWNQAIQTGAVEFLQNPLENERVLKVIQKALHPSPNQSEFRSAEIIS